ncbi:transcriptional regulator BetI [Pseudogemmobacter faecipullorum]|uniref:Transcriptional regulator BetI n=1 Tax=Pseudogemmobacter faecipullorum TaxID=2755041 RepID=A0ABS8CLR7_9RHOB|nr:transcriptional regulator BetI [Pseudogemmobacter faecipullorum]MCB5410332.1 transcriptional regulator BetI [Pseudogemmobacter faecipullorum]
MPKVGMEPVRRRQIIAATMAAIHKEGITRATFGRIAREAGVAPALIQHYFADKETLLLETFRSIYREFTAGMRRRLALANSPQERVTALLEAQIAPSVLTPEAVNTWLAIYALIGEYPLLQRIEHAFDRRFLSTLSQALRAMGIGRAEASDLAEELAIFIDGLWQNTANPVTFTPERARTLLYRVLQRLLPGQHFSPPADQAPRRAAEDAALSAAAQQFLRDYLPVASMAVSHSSIAGFRSLAQTTARPESRAAVKRHQVSLSRHSLAGIETLRIVPKSARAAGAAGLAQHFYLFGGGYISGDPEADLPISAGLAERLEAVVFSPSYRLAPEHPWPAAPEDALTAYRAFVATATEPFAVIGESAGGGLALAMLQAARDEGLKLPAAMVLLSPWCDLSGGNGFANDGWDPTITAQILRDAARLYAPGHHQHPSVSPLLGDLRGLPPAFITTGSRDIMHEQVYRLVDALQAAGVAVTLRDWPGLWHVFEFYPALPEATTSLDEISAFLRQHCSIEETPL